MIYPSIEELSKNKYNRYQLCIATAKCARKIISGEDVNRDILPPEEKISKKNIVDGEKPVKEAINRLYENKYVIVIPSEKDENQMVQETETVTE